jgi:hypothetical protein
VAAREPERRSRLLRGRDVPPWRQALEGIGLVTLGALLAVGVGALMALVVSWLF